MMMMMWERYPTFSHTVKMRDQLRRQLNQWLCLDLQLVLKEVSVHVFIKPESPSMLFGSFRVGHHSNILIPKLPVTTNGTV